MTDRKFANTLARGLSVLRAFRVSDDGITRTELVVRTGLAPATITRLTHTLKELGYLSQHGSLLRLGPAAFALASVANASGSFLDIADGAMQDLADRTRTMVLLAVPDGPSMTLVRTWRPQGVASIWLEPGNRVPIAHSSTGQAYLAGLSAARFAAKNPDAIWQQMRQAGRAQLATQGFSVIQGPTRYTNSVNAVAHPYLAGDLGEPVVFTCGATPDMLSDTRAVQEVGPALRDVVRALERQTGAPRSYDANN
ncbi:helix-turn-helix domain-containing protein [uncultured Roseobacter sp.]|uniref:IclR family transcriptional regulator n=1 Tax=uncultured Roseobacter sp. TaxID=114847 RepID=UPI002604BB1F|nr:helix-turn-helix domain-containing protein [uncultured Roseobacter sp.]